MGQSDVNPGQVHGGETACCGGGGGGKARLWLVSLQPANLPRSTRILPACG